MEWEGCDGTLSTRIPWDVAPQGFRHSCHVMSDVVSVCCRGRSACYRPVCSTVYIVWMVDDPA